MRTPLAIKKHPPVKAGGVSYVGKQLKIRVVSGGNGITEFLTVRPAGRARAYRGNRSVTGFCEQSRQRVYAVGVI